ncbi:cytochrome P450 [Sinosporangium siamense]|uniref:Cytochrome P450 n=1 Tax=Sinosporangium siamense TaxID=1367973 RepID=A0A919V5B2_9ACTN|nr:cytochrome P450 [Sinosporangium siamense]GII90661.1 cytochrome P450 [Sinosporangium siamense]
MSQRGTAAHDASETFSGPGDAPVADWVDAGDLSADPYPAYSKLRDQSPVVWVPLVRKFLVTSFDACHTVESDQELYSADVTGATMNRAVGGRPMLRKDGPDHRTARAPINPVLRPRSIREAWAPIFERNARRRLDVMREIGPSAADLNRDYAAPLASQNLIDMLGLHDVTVGDMQRWSHAFIAGIGNVLDDEETWTRSERASTEVSHLLDELIPWYRDHPDASMTSAFANSDLSTADVHANIKLVISGGMNEPQHMITTIVWALDKHPDQKARALGGESLWQDVFDEAARWRSPIGMYPRETTRPCELAGVRLPARAPLGVVVAAANRDPEAFGADAHEFDVQRPKRPHLAFGDGVHLCAGHWAARISIGQIAVPLLYQELPTLRIDRNRPATWEGWVFRGLTQCPVTWA